MGLMMPLMSILIRSFMIETQDPEEEIQALEDTMAVIQTLVDEKKEIQKQEKLERRRRRQERREELQHALMKSEQMSRSSKSSHSFLLVEDTSPSMQFKDKSKKEKKNRSDKKEQMPSGVPLEDMNPEDEAQGLPLNHCFCGLPVTTYVSRNSWSKLPPAVQPLSKADWKAMPILSMDRASEIDSTPKALSRARDANWTGQERKDQIEGQLKQAEQIYQPAPVRRQAATQS